MSGEEGAAAGVANPEGGMVVTDVLVDLVPGVEIDEVEDIAEE